MVHSVGTHRGKRVGAWLGRRHVPDPAVGHLPVSLAPIAIAPAKLLRRAVLGLRIGPRALAIVGVGGAGVPADRAFRAGGLARDCIPRQRGCARGVAGGARAHGVHLGSGSRSSWIAYSASRVPPELVSGGRSRGVPLAITAAACFYVWVEPWLYRVGYTLGFRGNTTLATTLPHRLDAPVLVLVCGTILVAPWIEELTFRGFLLSGLSARFGFWPAAAVSSVLWAAWHGVTGVLVPFTAAGLLLCWIRRRTGSTRTGIALHSANNVLAALAVGAPATLVVPPVMVVVLSLVVTRPGPPGRLRTGRCAAVGNRPARR